MNEKVILAIDSSTNEEVSAVIKNFKGKVKWVKVGMELFYSLGPSIISQLKDEGFSVFLDLKLHDIPNTVESALKRLCKYPIDMINVHALGGKDMMIRAGLVVKNSANSPYLIAVTQLTSTSEHQFHQIGFGGHLVDNVIKLAALTQEAHLDGVVCSAHEVSHIKKMCGQDFLCVTPGIRFSDQSYDDQKRVITPAEALALGSDFLVMGRSLIHAPHLLDTIPGGHL